MRPVALRPHRAAGPGTHTPRARAHTMPGASPTLRLTHVFANEVTPASPKALPFPACPPNCAAGRLWGPELDSHGPGPAATTAKENVPKTGHRALVDGVLSHIPALWPAFSKDTRVTSRSERKHQEAAPGRDGNQGDVPVPGLPRTRPPGPEQQAASSWTSHPARRLRAPVPGGLGPAQGRTWPEGGRDNPFMLTPWGLCVNRGRPGDGVVLQAPYEADGGTWRLPRQ